MDWLGNTRHSPSCFTCEKIACYSPLLITRHCLCELRFTRFMMPEAPVKLYIDKLLKESRNISRSLALLSGPVKEKALRAMADRLAVDEEKFWKRTKRM